MLVNSIGQCNYYNSVCFSSTSYGLFWGFYSYACLFAYLEIPEVGIQPKVEKKKKKDGEG